MYEKSLKPHGGAKDHRPGRTQVGHDRPEEAMVGGEP